MKNKLDYRSAGVDIEAGNQVVAGIKEHVKATYRPEVLSHLGGFSGLFAPKWQDYQKPVLVSATDGVGTKLKLAIACQQHHTIGIDLVAMCVNDLIVCGAEPLFFLDYFATAKLDTDTAIDVIKGIAQGCQQANAALIGGETAEMPGVYQNSDYDLAGFCVGMVDQDHIIDGSQVQVGDQLLGIASSGPHSNGYSLIRKILDVNQIELTQTFEQSTLGQVLLTPTRIYVSSLLSLFKHINVHACAHITGGGITENLPRVLPNNTQAIIDVTAWQWPSIFCWLQQQGQIEQAEMLKTFNCGIGMILCVAESEREQATQLLQQAGETVFHLGQIEQQSEAAPKVVYG